MTDHSIIGSGTYGKVIPDINEHNVIKIVDKFETDEKDQYCQQNIHEAVFLSQYYHPNIAQSSNIVIVEDKLHIKLKKYKSTLHNYIHETNYVDRMNKLDSIIYNILLGLNYIHNNNLIHGDLKPDNIMYDDETGDVNIIDFGGLSSFRLGNQGCICTYEFRAPEEWMDNNYLDHKFDIWSLGVIIFYFVVKSYPISFDDEDEDKRREQYRNYFKELNGKSFPINNDIILRLDPELQQLFKKMFEINKENRITVKELLKSKYFKKFKKSNDVRLKNMLVEQTAFNTINSSELYYISTVRKIGVEYIYTLCNSLKCFECFLHSVVLYDNYLSKCINTKNISSRKIRLIAISSLLISSILLLYQPFKFSYLKSQKCVKKYKTINKETLIAQTDNIMQKLNFKLYYNTFDWKFLYNNDINYKKIKQIVLDPNYTKLTDDKLYTIYTSIN